MFRVMDTINFEIPKTLLLPPPQPAVIEEPAPPVPPPGRWQRILHWEYFGLCVIVAVTLAFHFAAINHPPTIIWDETWYVEDARSIISGAGDIRPEHPPLAKLLVVAGIHMFGDNSFGWRFFSVIFGSAGIVLFYLLCRKLRLSWKASMFATFLLAFDDMTFLHSGLALLDVYMVTLMFAAILCYLNEWYILSGIFVALSAQCKLAGVLIIIALFLHWLIFRKTKWRLYISSLAVTVLAFFLFLVFFDYFMTGSFGTIQTFGKRIYDMFYLTDINVFSEPKLSIASRPWTWIYPQWYLFYYNSPNVPFIVYSYEPQYLSFISSTIQLLIIPTIGYMIYKTIKGNKIAPFVLLWFLATYLVWIPLDIVTNRITFVFYFLSTTPAICIGIGLALSDALDFLRARTAKNGKITTGVEFSYGVISMYLFIHFAIFMIFNPIIPVIVKSWEGPFGIGVDPTPNPSSISLLFFTTFPFFRRLRKT
jgi:dolichyl-phosphate-mannose-protein mannosyltransferase